MSIPSKIILYSVPDIKKVSGGPRTRITKISEAIKKESEGYSIIGNSLTKLKKTLKAPKSAICYVESATNRLKLIDLFCLIILKIKTKYLIVYIRDVYTIIFPQEYRSIRRSITRFFNHITNKIYIQLADKIAFPTIEMSKVFNSHFGINKNSIDLPPGTFFIDEKKTTFPDIASIKPKFLYLGGTNYKYSGINSFLKYAVSHINTFDFNILSQDNLEPLLNKKGLAKSIPLNSVSHDEVFDYINKNNISFLLHPRPLNEYDNITYPIKIMDCISFGLPIISFRHAPLVSMLGNEYPFFIESYEEIKKIIEDKDTFKQKYALSLDILNEVARKNTYQKQVQKIIKYSK
jgi:hypothetical protein